MTNEQQETFTQPRQDRDADLVAYDQLSRENADAQERLRRVRELFAGGPDTACRTTWRFDFAAHCEGYDGRVECVEVPTYDLRAALDAEP